MVSRQTHTHLRAKNCALSSPKLLEASTLFTLFASQQLLDPSVGMEMFTTFPERTEKGRLGATSKALAWFEESLGLPTSSFSEVTIGVPSVLIDRVVFTPNGVRSLTEQKGYGPYPAHDDVVALALDACWKN